MDRYADLLARSLEATAEAGNDDARARLARLYRALGVDAVAAALGQVAGEAHEQPDTQESEADRLSAKAA